MSQKRRSRSGRSRKAGRRRSRSRRRSVSKRRDRSSSRRRVSSPKERRKKDASSSVSSDRGEGKKGSTRDGRDVKRRRSKTRSRSRRLRSSRGRDRSRERRRDRKKKVESSSPSKSSEEPAMMDSDQEAEWLEKRRKKRQEIARKHEETANALLQSPSPSNKKDAKKVKKVKYVAPGTPAYIEQDDDGADIFGPFTHSPSPDSPSKREQSQGSADGDKSKSPGRQSKEDEKPDVSDVLEKLEEDSSDSESTSSKPSKEEEPTEEKEEEPRIVGGINITELRKNLEEEKVKLRIFIRKTKNAYEDAEEQGQEEIDKIIADYNPDLREDWDDAEGYYKPRIGEIIDGKYKCFAECAGKGVFSNVVKCHEITGQKRPVAIKIIRSNDMMRKAAEKEIEMLKTLNANDPDDRRHMVRLLDTFSYRNHLCLVFELLGHNLRQALRVHGKGRGLTLTAVHAYAWQLFISLRLIKKVGIVHADIKPDNLLIGDADGGDLKKLKICDLGSGLDAKTECDITTYLVSRFYRAPEIMLGQPYDYAIDIWAVGCTLFELLTGKILFKGQTNNDMLKQIIDVVGGTSKVIRKGTNAKRHFTPEGYFIWEDRDTYTKKTVLRTIKDLRPTVDIEKKIIGRCRPEHKEKARQLTDLIKRCLHLDPKKRITPDEAFEHPFCKYPVPKANK